MKRATLMLVGAIFLAFCLPSFSFACEGFEITSGEYHYSDNLNDRIQNEFGSGYRVADWNDLKQIADLEGWLSCMSFSDNQRFMVTKNGESMYSSNRQYYVKYAADGDPGGSFLVHAQIGGKLFLGSWDGNYHILAKSIAGTDDNSGDDSAGEPSPVCNGMRITGGKYNYSENLNSNVRSEFGSGYTIADWNDLKRISNIGNWVSCMNLSDNQRFMVTKNGEYKYSANRQYYVKYAADGDPGGSFMVHAQIGGKLFLGSWDGNYHILAKAVDNNGDSNGDDNSGGNNGGDDGSSSVRCEGFGITDGEYHYSDNLTGKIRDEFGSGYTIADWNDLKRISNIGNWVSCMNLSDNQRFMVTRNGEYKYSANRQYYVKYAADGDPGGSFMVHAQIGGKLFLGSWDGNYHILAKSLDDNDGSSGDDSSGGNNGGGDESSSARCEGFGITDGEYHYSDNLTGKIRNEFGSGYTIADWNDLKRISNIDNWVSCMNLSDNQRFMVTKNGKYKYSANRQYYVKYAADGNPGGSFMVHAQIGGKLFLGSWDGNYHILAKSIDDDDDDSGDDGSGGGGNTGGGSGSDDDSGSSSGSGCFIHCILGN
jgi:hypothetical protein